MGRGARRNRDAGRGLGPGVGVIGLMMGVVGRTWRGMVMLLVRIELLLLLVGFVLVLDLFLVSVVFGSGVWKRSLRFVV